MERKTGFRKKFDLPIFTEKPGDSSFVLFALLYTRFVQEFRKGNSERKSSKRGRDDERMREVTGDG